MIRTAPCGETQNPRTIRQQCLTSQGEAGIIEPLLPPIAYLFIGTLWTWIASIHYLIGIWIVYKEYKANKFSTSGKSVVYKSIAATRVSTPITSIVRRCSLARSFARHRLFYFYAVSVKVFQVLNSVVS